MCHNKYGSIFRGDDTHDKKQRKILHVLDTRKDNYFIKNLMLQRGRYP